jgi:putative zinc finger protein
MSAYETGAYATCGEVRIALGTYLLGAISPAERSRVDAHLGGCPGCRDELAGLASLPALLGRVDEAQITEVAGPPGELLDGLLTRAAASRPSRFRRWAPVAVAAAVLLTVGIMVGGVLVDSDRPRPASRAVSQPAPQPAPRWRPLTVEQVSATDPQTHVSAQIGMERKEWGTALVVQLQGAPPGTRCDLVTLAKDGRQDVAAGWQVGQAWGTGGYAATTFHGSTMMSSTEIRAFEIRTVDGRVLLTITPPSRRTISRILQ